MKRGGPIKRRTPLRRTGPIKPKPPRVRAAGHGKEPRVVDEEWLAEVRWYPCHFCGTNGPSQAHHVGGKGMGGARRRDDMAIPVCLRCHQRCHGQALSSRPPWPIEAQGIAAEQWQIKRAAWLLRQVRP